jgi:hypothetical protein
MNAYQLDDKVTDQDFLEGKIVRCKAAVKEAEATALIAGKRIVILLSSQKKYMGEVVSFHYQIKKGFAEGTMELIRFPRPISG